MPEYRTAEVHDKSDPNLDHLRLVAHQRQALERKVETLSGAQAAAEAQHFTQFVREYKAGSATFQDMELLYVQMRAIGATGWTRRWNEVMPVRTDRLRWAATQLPNEPDGSWSGEFPVPPTAPVPPKGKSVVYILYDETLTPAYVGSTFKFRERMKHHERTKPSGLWRAYPVASREEAYTLEDRLLKENLPYLNRKASR